MFFYSTLNYFCIIMIPIQVRSKEMPTHRLRISSPKNIPDSSTPNSGVRNLNTDILLALLYFNNTVHNVIAVADSIDRYIRTINAFISLGVRVPPHISPMNVRQKPPKVNWQPDSVIGLYFFVLFLLNIVPTAAQRDAINNSPSPFSENIPIPEVSPSADNEVILFIGTFLKLMITILLLLLVVLLDI